MSNVLDIQVEEIDMTVLMNETKDNCYKKLLANQNTDIDLSLL